MQTLMDCGNYRKRDYSTIVMKRVGKDMLERFMKINLCKSLNLDGGDIYTNHSI